MCNEYLNAMWMNCSMNSSLPCMYQGKHDGQNAKKPTQLPSSEFSLKHLTVGWTINNKDFTAVSNANLYASMIGITRTRSFGDYDAQEACDLLMRSAIFAGRTIGVEGLQHRIQKLCVYLPIVAGYLVNVPWTGHNGQQLTRLGPFAVTFKSTWLGSCRYLQVLCVITLPPFPTNSHAHSKQS